jgi:hypothetical protein
MRLLTIVELRKDGVAGRSVSSSEVSDGYGNEQIARRTIKQLDSARRDLIAGLTAKKAAAELQQELFPGEDFSGDHAPRLTMRRAWVSNDDARRRWCSEC